MKILLVSPAYFPSQFGGIKEHVTDLSRELAERGHAVTVYTTNADTFDTNLAIHGEHHIEGVRIIYLQNRCPKRYWFAPEVFKYANKEIKSYDVIHLHNNYSFLNAVVWFYAKKYGIPVVFSAHGSLFPRMRNRFFKALYNNLITKGILRKAKGLIALNDPEKEQYLLMGAHRDKISIIPNGIRLREYSEMPRREVFRRRYGISDRSLILLFLGRLHPIKGLDLLIEAFSERRINIDEIILVIAGPDFGFRKILEEKVKRIKISNKVLFTGGLFGKEKLEALSSADIFVLTSKYETCPMALLEACASGLPAIITDRVGIAESIREKAGIVVEYEVKGLAAAIIKMAKDSDMRKKMGIGAKVLIKQQFDMSNIVRRYEKIYTNKLK